MLPATFSRGNSSRTMPKASGKMPPAAPWSARPTTTSTSEPAIAESSVPSARITNVHSSTRSLPYMSPTDAARRYAVRIQVTPVSDVCRSCWNVGSAGITAPLSTAYASEPSARTASVTFGETLSGFAVM